MKVKMTYLDTGYYTITDRAAGWLAKQFAPQWRKKKLPKHGWEMLVIYEGVKYWLTRTIILVNELTVRKQVWALRYASQ